ncbi:MAG TPA: class I SAM-dependent methyltransferase [Solirubrobacteraceae bacterium]|nr:class I SAM-dependent methyltransferase [Solirubrobacteraceae bacterium]
MTLVICKICGSPAVPALVAVDRNRRLSSEHFPYYRCTVCRTLQLDPVPADLGRYYTAEYYAVPEDRAALVAAAGAERYKLELIRPLVPAGRLVEVGPAVGGFAAVMQDAGYDTSAIEMDADCCRFLREVVRVPVDETDDPARALAAGGPYDVIAMWHVIEHLPNPRQVLEAAAAALAPGGVIALAAPNPEAFQFRVFGRRWTHLDAPRHLCLAPLDAYAEVGRACGLEVAVATTRDEGTLHWNAFGWRETLAGFGGGRYVRGGMRLVGSAVTRVAEPIERRDRQGSTYTLLLRR